LAVQGGEPIEGPFLGSGGKSWPVIAHPYEQLPVGCCHFDVNDCDGVAPGVVEQVRQRVA